MKNLSIITLLIMSFLFASENCNGTTQFQRPIDSTFFKKKRVFVMLSPVTLSSSYNLNTGSHFALFSGRIGVNWVTKKNRKFQIFGMRGAGAKLFYPSKVTVNELGVTIGKLFEDKNNGFWDLNAGISYFGSETRTKIFTGSFWNGSSLTTVKVERDDTFGIPFEAVYYGSRFPIGLGIGIVGNLNIEHPYMGFSIRMRFGNPVAKVDSTRK